VSDPVITKEVLLKGHLPEETVEVPEIGTIRIRALSRAEALSSTLLADDEREAQVLAWGIVDPVITKEEAQRWRETTIPGLVNAVAYEILVLSGMTETAAVVVRAAKTSFQAEPES
jgi:hypothetical protein